MRVRTWRSNGRGRWREVAQIRSAGGEEEAQRKVGGGARSDGVSGAVRARQRGG